MELLARARIVMWEGGALWVIDATQPAVPGRRTGVHAHHAIQVTVGIGGTHRLETADAQIENHAAAVAADTAHTFQATGLVAHLFIEPESRQGRAAAARLFDGRALARVPTDCLADVPPRIAAAFRAAKRDDVALIGLGKALVDALAGGARAREPDARIRKVITWAGRNLDGPLSLSNAVPVANLSAGRLGHLFVDEARLPFKTYLLWLRLTRAVRAFAAGHSLTDAAHEAGFSDSAHLTRTFRRMFGVAPTALRMS
jgi:AraC-like DNA-binding protein